MDAADLFKKSKTHEGSTHVRVSGDTKATLERIRVATNSSQIELLDRAVKLLDQSVQAHLAKIEAKKDG